MLHLRASIVAVVQPNGHAGRVAASHCVVVTVNCCKQKPTLSVSRYFDGRTVDIADCRFTENGKVPSFWGTIASKN